MWICMYLFVDRSTFVCGLLKLLPWLDSQMHCFLHRPICSQSDVALVSHSVCIFNY